MLQHLKGYQRSITLIKTGRLNKKNTNINTSEKGKRGRETNTNMCNLSASTSTNASTYTINSKSSIHTSLFLLHSVTNQQQF